MREDLGYGEGAGVDGTLLIDKQRRVVSLAENSDQIPGFGLESLLFISRCDGRLQTKRFTRLSYTGLVVELEHFKIKTRFEKFARVKGECEI